MFNRIRVLVFIELYRTLDEIATEWGDRRCGDLCYNFPVFNKLISLIWFFGVNA